MLKKLSSVTILSSLGALFNFLTTFIIVHNLGLGILGKFTLVNSITGLCSLIYTLLPPNYSVFKYQDDDNYRYILTSFYVVASIPFVGILYVLHLLNSFPELSFGVVAFNGLTTIAFYYYDITYQAKNRLYRYFLQLLLQAVLKIIIIYWFYFTHLLKDNSSLIIATSLAQLICLIPYAKDFLKDMKLSKTFFRDPIIYIIQKFHDLKFYYLNAAIKRVKDNVIIVLFSKTLTSELIGLFTLFIKITSFVLSLGRSFEAFFANRENMEKYHQSFNRHILLLGGALQAVFIGVGLVYMKIYVHQYYFIEILILSFLVYPYSRFIVERMKFLGDYNNRELNISMIIYITFVVVSFAICNFFKITSLYTILLVYFISELLNYAHLIYKSVSKRIKTEI